MDLAETLQLVFCALALAPAGEIAGPARPGAVEPRVRLARMTTKEPPSRGLRRYTDAGAPRPRLEGPAEQGPALAHAFPHGPVCSVARRFLVTGCGVPRIRLARSASEPRAALRDTAGPEQAHPIARRNPNGAYR
jgi:hypothetical protein